MRFLALIFVFVISSAFCEYKHDLAAVMIFKNEAPYLKEWIEYYRIQGVTKFYLYDNASADNCDEILHSYVKKGIVELEKRPVECLDLPKWNGVQCSAYTYTIKKAVKDKVKWLLIVDSDEFAVPATHKNMIELLKEYETKKIGGVTMNWVMFGTSFVYQIPYHTLMIEALTFNQGYKKCGAKSIVRPDRVDSSVMGGPHHQNYLPGYVCVEIPFEKGQLNHYWTRDEYYLENFKIPRRLLWGTDPEVCATWKNKFNIENEPASVPILRFAKRLRKKLGFTLPMYTLAER
jgi:hypothetical protein